MRRLLTLVVMSLIATSAIAQTTTLTFGVLNQQSPARTAQRWNPIFQYLTQTTGIGFRLKMGATVHETNTMMARGEFDLAFTNHNFRPEYDGTYKVIARWGAKPIFGVIAVQADSPIQNLKQLAGKKIAFPSKEAFVAYAVPQVALNKAKVDFTTILAGNQEGALAQLKSGQVEAAAVNSRFLTQYAAQFGLRYREVYVSEPYADLPVIAHPRLPKEQVEAIRKALLAMKTDPKAASTLETAGFGGFEPATDKDYDNARAIYSKVRE